MRHAANKGRKLAIVEEAKGCTSGREKTKQTNVKSLQKVIADIT